MHHVTVRWKLFFVSVDTVKAACQERRNTTVATLFSKTHLKFINPLFIYAMDINTTINIVHNKLLFIKNSKSRSS